MQPTALQEEHGEGELSLSDWWKLKHAPLILPTTKRGLIKHAITSSSSSGHLTCAGKSSLPLLQITRDHLRFC